MLGIAVLGESVRPGPDGWVLLLAAVAIMVVATAALARSEATGASPLGAAQGSAAGR